MRVAACWLTYCRVCIEYRKRRINQTSGGTRSGPRRRSANAMNPTNTRKPIYVKMFMSILARTTPVIEQSKHIGTTRITAMAVLPV